MMCGPCLWSEWHVKYNGEILLLRPTVPYFSLYRESTLTYQVCLEGRCKPFAGAPPRLAEWRKGRRSDGHTKDAYRDPTTKLDENLVCSYGRYRVLCRVQIPASAKQRGGLVL